MASGGFCWSACLVPCCLSIPACCHTNPRLSHPILPALLQKDLPHRQTLSYWEHHVDSTHQNPFLNSISGDHSWLLSFFRLLGKEMSTVLAYLVRACSCPELQKAGMKTKPIWTDTPSLKHLCFSRDGSLCKWLQSHHEISTVSNRDWPAAPSNLLPDLEVTANKQTNKQIRASRNSIPAIQAGCRGLRVALTVPEK